MRKYNINKKYWTERYNKMGGINTVGFVSWTIEDYVKYNRMLFDKVGRIIDEYIPDVNSIRKILDYGCGIGRCTEFLKSKFPNAHYIGVDIVDKFTDKYNDEFHLIGDDGNINIGNVMVDFIWTYVVLQHIVDDELLNHIISQFYNILRNNSYVLSIENTHKVGRNNYIVYRSVDEYLHLFERHGFKVNHICDLDFLSSETHSVILAIKQK